MDKCVRDSGGIESCPCVSCRTAHVKQLRAEIEWLHDHLRDAVLFVDRYRDGDEPCDASVASWRASVTSDVKL